jgi:acyl-CoA dehydrogenase
VSETALLEQVTAEILRDHTAGRDPGFADEGWSAALWASLEGAGLPLVGIPEERGGAGGGWPEIAAVLRAAGRFAAPVPLAETCALAGWLLAMAELPIPSGPLTAAPMHPADRLEIVPEGGGWRLRGVAARVPWASQATAIVVLARHGAGHVVASIPPSACRIEAGANLAGEPRDRVTFADVRLSGDAVAPVEVDADQLLVRGALARSIQMVGALDRILGLTVEYVQTRTQFGRSLGRFQAVQHDLARLAGEVVASAAAVEGAVAAAGRADCTAEVAAARVRAGEAAALGARVAHQLHGAIGFTHEHQLHRYTTRLWSWRDELGAEREWAVRLGRFSAAAGPAGYWDWFSRDLGPAFADRRDSAGWTG